MQYDNHTLMLAIVHQAVSAKMAADLPESLVENQKLQQQLAKERGERQEEKVKHDAQIKALVDRTEDLEQKFESLMTGSAQVQAAPDGSELVPPAATAEIAPAAPGPVPGEPVPTE